ncbi:MAG: phosphotransferase [Hahellaceae bacterium]|nr:phosphotransferase [Hahellaceae bacterium]MCP5170444.1 phosphotransferase [Hahellaceae bacterium]
MDFRLARLTQWAEQVLHAPVMVTPVSGDASFRRYFRLARHDAPALIAMDAPPDKEDCRPFVALARHWHAQGIHVPALIAKDLSQGFLILDDFGDDLYLPRLQQAAPDDVLTLYRHALTMLLRIQTCDEPPDYSLPVYDEALLWREMELFRDWLTGQKLALTLTAQEHELLNETWQFLIHHALAQPSVTVHRDYHSRNLMITPDTLPGVLDFQDAVCGPLTYDLVSLLRDCYITWPDELVNTLLEEFWQATADKNLHTASLTEFTRWFDLMGIQRHLKAAGIFARLSIRDGKHGYLADIPSTVNYIVRISQRYPELAAFSQWLSTRFLPALSQLGESHSNESSTTSTATV